ncbi:MAG: zf-HC2 domain-containing protein [Nitrospinae bacterium]|nr:zf-HC2 domain-containing protein [Nitrospinota bacterium]
MGKNGHHHHGGKGNCKKTLTGMSEYVDDDLKGSGRKSLENHLAGCKACMAVLNTLKKTIEIFRVSTPRMPASMAKEVRRGVKHEIAALEKKGK